MPGGLTPLLLVTGFLGAGKTTQLRHWLARRPAGERWAVVVNDFGALAVDAAAFEGVEVGEVAGGCACCAAAVAMRVALDRLRRRGPWDLIVVELSGLGHPGPLVDALLAVPGVRVDGVVAVVDASRPAPWLDASARYRDLARGQVDCSDVVVLNRGDRADPATLAALVEELAGGPFGARPVLRAGGDGAGWPDVARALSQGPGGSPGRLKAPDGAADGPGAGLALPVGAGHGGRRWLRSTADGTTIAWQWPSSRRFDRRRLQRWAGGLADAGPLVRGKGAFRTERDWYLWQRAGGDDDWSPTAWRRDNRVECLFDGDVDAAALEAGLLGAMLDD